MGLDEDGDLNAKKQEVDIHVVSSSESSEGVVEDAADETGAIDKGVYRAIVYWSLKKEEWRQRWEPELVADGGAGKRPRRSRKSTRKARKKFYGAECGRGPTP